jgi:hypothetical protein
VFYVGIKSVKARKKGRVITADLIYVRSGTKSVKVEDGHTCPADVGLQHEEPPVAAVLSFHDNAKDCDVEELKR